MAAFSIMPRFMEALACGFKGKYDLLINGKTYDLTLDDSTDELVIRLT